ncbi:hypothetical protein D3C81_1263440 [compost metagenome]
MIVPVLSEHKIFILPKFSIAERRLTMTFCAAIFFAPVERLTVIITGSNCGVSPTARARENRKESRTGLWRNTFNANMTRISIKVICMSKKPNFLIPLSNSVSGALFLKRADIFPNSVFNPVAMTSAVAFPLMTLDPINKVLERLERGVFVSSFPFCFSTG